VGANQHLLSSAAELGALGALVDPRLGHKLTFLRHEIFQWVLGNRYEPGTETPDE